MLAVVIGGFRSELSITCKTDENFENVSASVLFSRRFNENSGKIVITIILEILPCITEGLPFFG